MTDKILIVKFVFSGSWNILELLDLDNLKRYIALSVRLKSKSGAYEFIIALQGEHVRPVLKMNCYF